MGFWMFWMVDFHSCKSNIAIAGKIPQVLGGYFVVKMVMFMGELVSLLEGNGGGVGIGEVGTP